jgi:hypothetical protein
MAPDARLAPRAGTRAPSAVQLVAHARKIAARFGTDAARQALAMRLRQLSTLVACFTLVSAEPSSAQVLRQPPQAVPAMPPTAMPVRLGPPSDHAAYFRAALEVVAVLGIGVSQYWIAAANNTRDWDFPRWSERLSDVNVRFDNNTQVTNNLLHPLAGAAYYGLSRANGLSIGESVLYAQLASAIWEVGLEWREKVSINDMIVTTAGGTGVGECLVQLAAYLNSAPDGGAWPQDVAAVTLGFPVWVHDELDDRQADPRPAKDALGFSAAYQHRFTLELQNSWLDDAAGLEQQLFGVRLDVQLSSLSGLLAPKTFSTWFAGGNFSEMSLELGFDHEGRGVHRCGVRRGPGRPLCAVGGPVHDRV